MVPPKLSFARAGFVFLAVLWILNAIFVIIAAIQASDGKFYRPRSASPR